ncbi:hypothetical protein MKW98_024132 [Papaver atlanticum]|uniref:Uncharacterized protein n=1 Tax=Papaver atlanticum TaxID=357466 RepID=A0AAD4T0H3_9MAGN|nr:hypothetical protein MKW98_024132 [Papaver atlanticum]
MKKLYKKGKIHPSSPHHFSDQLAFLPATILTLTVALSPEDREVLAYLICFSGNLSSFTGSRKKNYGGGSSGFNGGEHSTSFNCDCFRCYTSFWFRWDCSPNRQLIHEIIDAYENDNQVLATDKKKMKMKQSKKDRKKKESSDTNTAASANNNSIINDNEVVVLEMKQFEQVSEEIFDSPGSFEIINGVGDISDNDDDDNVVIEEVKQQDLEKGSMRKLISFVGGKIWGVWG